ncbi:hypothetical protein F4815DRAFT_109702 [Daldinia loculata]|nr:hypothetical protein F4815DRAFT_109702 [Daldinia loculata]
MKASLQDTRYPHCITLRYVLSNIALYFPPILHFTLLPRYLTTYLVLPTVLGSVLIYPKNLYSKGSKKGVVGLDWVRLELYIPILRTKCTTPLVWIGFKLRIGSNYIVSVLSVCLLCMEARGAGVQAKADGNGEYTWDMYACLYIQSGYKEG